MLHQSAILCNNLLQIIFNCIKLHQGNFHMEVAATQKEVGMSEIRDQLRRELLEDSQAYCCYCGQERVSFGCCGENHFETFSEMSKQTQDDFLNFEGV